MAQLKTVPNDQSVELFLQSINNEQRKKDCYTVLEIMKEATGSDPQMWGPSIIGFGHYHYTYESGREGDWFLTGFSPRKQNLTLYIMPGFSHYEELMHKLGKYTTGKSCLYIKKLEDIDQLILTELIKESIVYLKKKYT